MALESTADTAQRPPLLARVAASSFGTIVGLLILMWLIEAIDTIALSSRLQANGIHPREIDGLDGVLWAPFLHGDWGHIAANSVPFALLGWLVALRGKARWVLYTVVIVVVGGGLTWLFAGGSNHIGASGVVFGYFGALLGAAFFERRPATIAPALVAILLYGGMIAGLVPQERISWEGHLFGFIAGIFLARRFAEPRPARSDEADEFDLLAPD